MKNNNRVRVLLVEDNLTDQLSFKHYIKTQQPNYECAIAGSVAQALAVLENTQDFDIVLVDHDLGDGTAFDVLPVIPHSMPFIVITGSNDVGTAIKAMKSGASDFLIKDIEGDYLNLLPLVISNVIKAKQLEIELENYKEDLEFRVAERTKELSAEIQQRKQAENKIRVSEQRWQFALESAQSGVWEWDFVTNETTYSPNGLKILGFKEDEANNRFADWEKRVHPDDLEGCLAMANEHIVGGTPYYENTYRLLFDDGQYRWLLARGKVIEWSAEHQPLKLIGTIEDITARLQKEEIFNRSQKMDALGKLTGGIAHDYNNMLGIILGYSELLMAKVKGQVKLEEYVNQITRSAERGSELTQRLLSFSKHKKSAAETVDINALMFDHKNMLEKILTSRIILELDLGVGLWNVNLDSGDLENVIINVCINAMHAVESTGTLTIQTSNEQMGGHDTRKLKLEAGDYVRLGISDTGCGMSDKTLEKIFDPFFSTKGEYGTGLGLSQVYGFIERSNGAIDVSSTVGVGSQFVMYFPRFNALKKIKQEDQKQSIKNSKNKTILIVDDEPALLELTEEILLGNGYKVFCAAEAEQALSILTSESIDLMVSDVIMPGMDGYQLAEIVKEKFPLTRIQLASGYADESRLDILDQGLRSQLLQKPYSSRKLLEKIKGHFS
ncbi:MAG: response regulator [Pseudomonadales bacterium]|nr:response regulator [Pseudomonadales bacterium]